MNRSGHYDFNPPAHAKVSSPFAYELGPIVTYDLSRDPEPGQDIVLDKRDCFLVLYFNKGLSLYALREVVYPYQHEHLSTRSFW